MNLASKSTPKSFNMPLILDCQFVLNLLYNSDYYHIAASAITLTLIYFPIAKGLQHCVYVLLA